jgi:hypothetical protein
VIIRSVILSLAILLVPSIVQAAGVSVQHRGEQPVLVTTAASAR